MIPDSLSRYIPQFRLEEIQKDGQIKLVNSRILIVGCGALGSSIAMYLAGAGIGNIVIADYDTIEISNLHRQVFYSENEVGQFKVDCLKEKMLALNSEVNIDAVKSLITRKFLDSDSRFDLIVDAADNPATTYMLNDFCSHHSIPFSTAGVSEWKAQVFTYLPGSFSFKDIFPSPDSETSISLPCQLVGIIGPIASFAASIQSINIIQVLVGAAGNSSSLIYADFRSGIIKKIEGQI